jgi:hypothetical protein
MRKFGVLAIVALLGALLMVSAGTRAEDQLDATVRVFLDAVFDITIESFLKDITVTQAQLDLQESQKDLGYVWVKVFAISDWLLGLCYDANSDKYDSVTEGEFAFTDNPIYEYQMDEGEDYETLPKNFIPHCYVAAFFPGAGGEYEDWADPHNKFVKVKAEGENNTDSPYKHNIGFGIHLDNLGDRAAGETLTFDLHFALLDPTDP